MIIKKVLEVRTPKQFIAYAKAALGLVKFQ
jgi:hypothetical protein